MDNNEIQNTSNEEMMGIDELKLSYRSYNCLKRADINTLEDTSKVRNLGRKSLEEVLEKLKKLGYTLNEESDDGTNATMTEEERRNLPGHDKCEKLREIRKMIAEINEIDFEPAVCHHNGPCSGTCPVCDKEVEYLDKKLQEKKERGEEVILTGLSIDVNDVESDDNDDHEYDTRGEAVNFDDDDIYGEDEDWDEDDWVDDEDLHDD